MNFTLSALLNSERPEELLEGAYPFVHLMMQYRCAMQEVQTKLDVLNTELSLDQEHNPFESITGRIKKPISIIGKLKKLNLDVSLENIERHLHDVAGIRVICTFQKDIYILAEKLCAQDDIRLIDRKDYIKNPKPNGYRSLHLIVEIPVFLPKRKNLCRSKSNFALSQWIFGQALNTKSIIRRKLIATPFSLRKSSGFALIISIRLPLNLKISAKKSSFRRKTAVPILKNSDRTNRRLYRCSSVLLRMDSHRTYERTVPVSCTRCAQEQQCN